MFEEGEEVICINNINITKMHELSIGKKYTIDEIKKDEGLIFLRFNESNFKYKYVFYNCQRFLYLSEYRRLKIKKIMNKINEISYKRM
jgi:hypothetical protein